METSTAAHSQEIVTILEVYDTFGNAPVLVVKTKGSGVSAVSKAAYCIAAYALILHDVATLVAY